jgi:hypothetical protein
MPIFLVAIEMRIYEKNRWNSDEIERKSCCCIFLSSSHCCVRTHIDLINEMENVRVGSVSFFMRLLFVTLSLPPKSWESFFCFWLSSFTSTSCEFACFSLTLAIVVCFCHVRGREWISQQFHNTVEILHEILSSSCAILSFNWIQKWD